MLGSKGMKWLVEKNYISVGNGEAKMKTLLKWQKACKVENNARHYYKIQENVWGEKGNIRSLQNEEVV